MTHLTDAELDDLEAKAKAAACAQQEIRPMVKVASDPSTILSLIAELREHRAAKNG